MSAFPPELLQAVLALLMCLLGSGAAAPVARVSVAAMAALWREMDGRCGARRSHAASYSRDWWERAVPAMSANDFARTFRVSRAVFNMLLFAAETSMYFAAPEYTEALPVALQLAMGLYKCVYDCPRAALDVFPLRRPLHTSSRHHPLPPRTGSRGPSPTLTSRRSSA